MKAQQNRKEKPSVLFIVIFAVLTVYVLTMAFPLLWGMFTSLKDQTEFRKNVLWLPHGWPWEWKWSNFVRVSTGFYETVTTVGVGRKRVYFPQNAGKYSALRGRLCVSGDDLSLRRGVSDGKIQL